MTKNTQLKYKRKAIKTTVHNWNKNRSQMSLLKGLFGFYLFSLLFSEKLKDDHKNHQNHLWWCKKVRTTTKKSCWKKLLATFNNDKLDLHFWSECSMCSHLSSLQLDALLDHVFFKPGVTICTEAAPLISLIHFSAFCIYFLCFI